MTVVMVYAMVRLIRDNANTTCIHATVHTEGPIISYNRSRKNRNHRE